MRYPITDEETFIDTVPSNGVKASKTFAAARARLGNPDE